MKKLTYGAGMTAGVTGMGRSGAAAAELLCARGYTVKGFDSSSNASGPDCLQRLVTGDPGREELSDLTFMVMSPGVPPGSAVFRMTVEEGVPVIPEVELGWAASGTDAVAVTGSNGKTTTVEWLGHLFRGSELYSGAIAAGNTGYAMCRAVHENPGCPLFVLEVSSYQLETISDFRPVSAAVLNLTPDHLARHGTMEEYGKAKARIFMNQRPEDTSVLNADDPLLSFMERRTSGRLLRFSMKGEVDRGAWIGPEGKILFRDGASVESVIGVDRLGIPGKHNAANALAVTCISFSMGIPVKTLSEALQSFRGVPHRLEDLGVAAGVRWVNDSKSTNIDSLKVALESFNEPVVLLAGGLQKDSDYSVLRELIRRRTSSVVLYGSGAGILEEAWTGASRISRCHDLEEAVESALKEVRPGGTVLLSPGCASFDQYRDFEERGEHFRKIVGGLS